MDLKVDAIAKARANVERALAKPDKALSNALQAHRARSSLTPLPRLRRPAYRLP